MIWENVTCQESFEPTEIYIRCKRLTYIHGRILKNVTVETNILDEHYNVAIKL